MDLSTNHTVAVTARRLGISPRAVRAAIARGSLAASEAFGVTVVSDDEIERYRAEHLGRRGPAPRKEDEDGH